MREKNKNEGSGCGDEAHSKPSILKTLFSSQYLTYLDVVESEGRGNLSSVIKDTFDAFAKCGSMTEGFAYLRCDTCEEFQVCGFSCKRRGFCPRCASRRGASHEVHLMDNVFPEVDVRQWVMTYPPQIRYLIATNREAMNLENPDCHFVLPRMSAWDKGLQAKCLRMFLTGIGLPQVRFHDLRASWATIMLSKGIPPAKVMKMGGWKDIKTMMVYMRKAGLDIKGITDGLDLHTPGREAGKVLNFSQSSEA